MTASVDVSSVAILFSPRAVSVIDLFRTLAGFDHRCGGAAVDQLQTRLVRCLGERAAKNLLSDAMLLASSLSRGRAPSLQFSCIGSRRGTLDEYKLLSLLSAAYWRDDALVRQTASALVPDNVRLLISLATRTARRLQALGVKLDRGDPRVLGAPRATPERLPLSTLWGGSLGG